MTGAQVMKSPLFNSQKELGAQFVEAYGWEMAERYTDPREEHAGVRSAVGLVDLSFYGAIKIGGKEAIQFLNGLITNDVKTLGLGKGMRAAFLTGHGKVRALCRILGLGDEFLIINDPQTHDKVYKYVFPFTFAGDFKAEDVSDGYRVLSVQGPNSLQVMKEVCFEPLPTMEANDWVQTIVAGQHVTVVKISRTGEAGYDVMVPAEGLADVWDFLLMKGGFHSIVPFGLRALDTLRIEAGIPVYGSDADENNMMLELGMADAVSYTKGCYTGQEAVAMATYRGHVSKKLSGMLVEGEVVPDRGAKITGGGKDLGVVTSAIASGTLGCVIAMGYIRYGFFEPGKSVQIEASEGSLNAAVTDLPFYKRNL
jgi:glycine cleavage system T protein